jgi:hypothetical protein
MIILENKGRTGLYKTNRVAIYHPVSGTMSVGYDNVTSSPYVNTNYYFMFKHKFSTIYTGGEMSVRVPITSVGANIQQRLTPATDTNNTSLNIMKYSVVGDNPTNGTNGYIAFIGAKWGTRSTSTYVEFFTTDSGAISALNTTEYFWFSIQLRTSTNFFYRGVLSYYQGTNNCQLRRYVNYTKDWDLRIDVIDTSHA